MQKINQEPKLQIILICINHYPWALLVWLPEAPYPQTQTITIYMKNATSTLTVIKTLKNLQNQH